MYKVSLKDDDPNTYRFYSKGLFVNTETEKYRSLFSFKNSRTNRSDLSTATATYSRVADERS